MMMMMMMMMTLEAKLIHPSRQTTKYMTLKAFFNAWKLNMS